MVSTRAMSTHARAPELEKVSVSLAGLSRLRSSLAMYLHGVTHAPCPLPQRYVCLHDGATPDVPRLVLALRARKRRQARARPVQTSTTPPAEARAATIWPTTPPASPVCTGRTQARRMRPRL